MAVSLYADPADDYERYSADLYDDDGRPALYLCVKCRGYQPRERLPGERDGGFLCDQCCGPATAASE